MKNDKNDLGAVSATEGDAVSCLVPAPELPHAEPTLLEKAKKAANFRAITRRSTPEHSELMVAWLRDEVTTKQAAIALGIPAGNSEAKFASLLRHGFRNGHFNVALKTDWIK